MMVDIRPPAGDAEQATAVAVIQDCLAPSWRFGGEALTRSMAACFIACVDDALVGAIGIDPNIRAIQVVGVLPEYRRRGIGSQLVTKALNVLHQHGNETFAGGRGEYLWPGVPATLPGAIDFMQNQGFRTEIDFYDLTQRIREYETPRDVEIHAERNAFTVRYASPIDRDFLVDVSPKHWPSGWSQYFRDAALENIVVAIRNGSVVAALIVGRPGQASMWEPMLGSTVSTIGCVGTLTSHRHCGAGTFLVARATEILRDAGSDICHIGYTTLLDFYGRLGYRPWRAYKSMTHVAS